MTTKATGLHAKLAEVMAEAERIPKNGTAPKEMGGFSFVQVGDAADFIRKALGDRGVSMLPSSVEPLGESEHETKSGSLMTTYTVRTTWTLVDGETGQSATIQSIGTGADRGDKFAPKAQTNAMKYALLMGFLLSTGDDPEQHDTSDRQAQAGSESVELLGKVDVRGKAVPSRSNDHYKGEWKQGPGGFVIGFALQRGGDKDIPQVVVTGAVGVALHVADPEASFMGQTVHLKGRLYVVKRASRTSYNRLVVGEAQGHFIETDEWRIPPDESDPVAPGQTSSFDEDADLDAAMAKVPA